MERQKHIISSFINQPREPGWASLKSELLLLGLPHAWKGSKVLNHPSPVAFLGTIEGRYIATEAASTQTGTKKKVLHHMQQFNVLCHNASPSNKLLIYKNRTFSEYKIGHSNLFKNEIHSSTTMKLSCSKLQL